MSLFINTLQHGHSTSSLTSTTPNHGQAAEAAARLDEKYAVGMNIHEVANLRWLTAAEVMEYIEAAAAANPSAICAAPPAIPPATGTLLLFNASQTTNYQDDGISWVHDKRGKKNGAGHKLEACDSDTISSTSGDLAAANINSCSASGACAKELSCAERPTFHRREYRAAGPSDSTYVLLQYLDIERASILTSELFDQMILLSANSGAGGFAVAQPIHKPPETHQARHQGNLHHDGKRKVRAKPHDLRESTKSHDASDTMNILMIMVDENDSVGASTMDALSDNVFHAATDAAHSAVVKHVSPNEASAIVNAIVKSLEEKGVKGGVLSDVPPSHLENIEEDLTADINEAIDQILSGGGEGEEAGDEGNNSNPSDTDMLLFGSKTSGDTVKGIEDQIISSLEEVLPEALRSKLIETTEKMLEVSGVSLRFRMNKRAAKPTSCSVSSIGFGENASSVNNAALNGSGSKLGQPLPDIVDITPQFHIISNKREHSPSMVLSTQTPIPDLPPFVDQYYVWEKFAAFVNVHAKGNDIQVRTVRFQRLKELTPFSYKCKIPPDIATSSIFHVVVVGVLLPKDHRALRNMRGIELALKLCVQSEWSKTPWTKARPLLIAPCGGSRMQLLTQISRMKITIDVRKPDDDMSTTEDDVCVDKEDLQAKSGPLFSKEDCEKLRQALSLASGKDPKEINPNAEEMREYLRESNHEAISAASNALRKATKKESDILRKAHRDDDPNKLQLSRALAIMVLRKNHGS